MNRQAEMIQLYAKQLRLPTVARYEEVMREAGNSGWDYEAFLEALLAAEVEQRQSNQKRVASKRPVSRRPRHWTASSSVVSQT